MHDLEPVRNPVHAGEDRRFISGHGRCLGDVELDLRFDARLQQVADEKVRFAVGHVDDGGVVDVTPLMGAHTRYSSQMLRFVKPILGPTGRATRAIRLAWTSWAAA